MMLRTSSVAFHSLQLMKLLQISIRFLICSFLCFLFSRYCVTLKVTPTLLEQPTPFLFFLSVFFSACYITLDSQTLTGPLDSSSSLLSSSQTLGFSPLIYPSLSSILGSSPHFMAVSLSFRSVEIENASERILQLNWTAAFCSSSHLVLASVLLPSAVISVSGRPASTLNSRSLHLVFLRKSQKNRGISEKDSSSRSHSSQLLACSSAFHSLSEERVT